MTPQIDQIIEAFGGMAEMARKLNHPHITRIAHWRKSGNIPDWRHSEVIDGALRGKVDLPQTYIDEHRGLFTEREAVHGARAVAPPDSTSEATP